MDQDHYHQFVLERLGEEFPDLIVKVEYRPQDCSTTYKVFLDSEIENPFKDPVCSAVDFVCERKSDCLSHLWLCLREERRGAGLGRKLIAFLEEVALKLGRPRLQVNINVNESFWEHMGFSEFYNVWLKDVDHEDPVFRCRWCPQ